jgi:DNA polymerase III delta prime subunit
MNEKIKMIILLLTINNQTMATTLPLTFHHMGIWINDKKPNNMTDIIGNTGICKLLNKYLETGQIPNLLFIGDHGVGKRTLAGIFAKTYLAEDFTRARLFIDGAISRGKDVISDGVQEFARCRVSGSKKKLIIITNFDCMTHEAQNALRRIMELESSVRFILTGNDTGEIIEALQSRCVTLRVKGLDYEESRVLIKRIAPDMCDDIAEIISMISEGDMKRIINYCQTAMCHSDSNSTERFYRIFNIPPIKYIEDLIHKIHQKEAVFDEIDFLMDQGHNYNDILDILSRILAYRTDLIPDDVRYRYLGAIAEHYCEITANAVRLNMYALCGKLSDIS